MSKHLAPITFAAILAFAVAIPGFGLWGNYSNDKPVVADNWPQPIVKAINAYKRVYGAGSWDLGWTFYFAGNTNDVNRFLEQVATEKSTPLTVVLVPDPGDNFGISDPFEGDIKAQFSWLIHLYPDRDGLPGQMEIEPKRTGETDQQFTERRKQELAKLPEFGATVTILCKGPIDSNALKIPLVFRASLGGSLANLVDRHNERRAQLEKDGKPLAGEPPTDMKTANAPQSLFGPATEPAKPDAK